MRGEHRFLVVLLLLVVGSAPRARGTHAQYSVRPAARRISPACAGNTACARSRQPRATDQPRVRGEHNNRGPDSSPITGSAPRARGTRETPRPTTSPPRISPACAGNTNSSATPSWRSTDQPRVRGEHDLLGLSDKPGHGSAPRARGTPFGYVKLAAHDRISPACAGNTGRRSPSRSTAADQPRVRGEHT